jgi:hypothetical protein
MTDRTDSYAFRLQTIDVSITAYATYANCGQILEENNIASYMFRRNYQVCTFFI